jgi:hypothetical protein
MGKETKVTWPSNLATPKESTDFALRQPSPDPWGGSFSSGPPSEHGIDTPRLVVHDTSSVDVAPTTLQHTGLAIVEEEPVWDTPEDKIQEEPANQAPVTPVESTPADASNDGVPSTSKDEDSPLTADSDGQVHEDQPSTPSNETTDPEENHEDSLHTSIDEESKLRPPSAKQISGKVQELVEKFDGLARAASEEPEVARPRSKSPLSIGRRDGTDDADDADDGADFGEFEDAEEVDEPVATSPPITGPTSPVVSSKNVEASMVASSPVAERPSSQAGPTKFGSLNFTVDLGLISKLFKDAKQLPRNPKAEDDVPDYVLKDSFTEISHRKTWYRISRLGSSRRHDAADDEAYRRVTWATSTVHDETIKIVRRWMEEDSIAGRVQLGGLAAKTQKNMFGWDSTAEPVALEAVFGKRRAHSRNASLQPPPKSTSLSGVVGSDLTGSHRPSGSLGSAVASFSWSSSPLAPQPSPKKMPAKEVSVAAQAPRKSQDASTALPPPAPAPPPASVTPQPAPSAPSALSISKPQPVQPQPFIQDEDDDDEWGEMVSSPVTSHPTVAVTAPTITAVISSTTKNEPSSPALPVTNTLPPAISSTNPETTTSTTSFVGPTPTASNTNPDPWASVDFSVFETPSVKQASPASQKPPESPQKQSSSALLTEIPAALPVRPAIAEPRHVSSGPRGANTNAPGIGPLEEDDEAAAQKILAGLPDLSYMLR